jgi:hypothetical protein
MTKEASAALQLSIAHWERLTQGKREGEEGPCAEDCDLCLRYQNPDGDISSANACKGCPVFEHTGAPLCGGTPFRKAYSAFLRFGPDSDIFKRAAARELAFLRGLLPHHFARSPEVCEVGDWTWAEWIGEDLPPMAPWPRLIKFRPKPPRFSQAQLKRLLKVERVTVWIFEKFTTIENSIERTCYRRIE